MAGRYSSAMTHANGERQGGSRITKEKAGLKSYSQEFSRVKNCRTLFLFLPHCIVGLYGLRLDDHRGITSLRVLLLILIVILLHGPVMLSWLEWKTLYVSCMHPSVTFTMRNNPTLVVKNEMRTMEDAEWNENCVAISSWMIEKQK